MGSKEWALFPNLHIGALWAQRSAGVSPGGSGERVDIVTEEAVESC